MPWKVTPLAYTSGQSESDRPKMYTVRCCIRTREVPKSPTFFPFWGKATHYRKSFHFSFDAIRATDSRMPTGVKIGEKEVPKTMRRLPDEKLRIFCAASQPLERFL